MSAILIGAAVLLLLAAAYFLVEVALRTRQARAHTAKNYVLQGRENALAETHTERMRRLSEELVAAQLARAKRGDAGESWKDNAED